MINLLLLLLSDGLYFIVNKNIYHHTELGLCCDVLCCILYVYCMCIVYCILYVVIDGVLCYVLNCICYV